MNGLRSVAPAALFGVGLIVVSGVFAQQQPAVPDAPAPAPASMPGTNGPITPGLGSGEPPTGGPTSSSSTAGQPQPDEVTPPPTPPAAPPPSAEPQNGQGTAAPEEGNAAVAKYVVRVNFVQVPVTVKDPKGNLVAGLGWRDFTVYENNVREHLSVFSVDPSPLSIAYVIDQTLPANVMSRVNQSLASIQGALTPYDEAAVFTYTNGIRQLTAFTGAQGDRLPMVLSMAQAVGTDPMVPITGGNPLSGACSISVNGQCPDPNLQPGHQAQLNGTMNLPKDIHTLNDAILQAAKELSTRPRERLRVIYVVSDGKEYGSKATWTEVRKYLETNKIAVYATLVGDSSHWGEGWLNRFHIPWTGVYDNILYKYVSATGGDMYAEGNVNGIEKSYERLAGEARNQYLLGYLSNAPLYDEKFRSIDVRVDRPNVVVTAKTGYYPSAQDYK